MNFSIFINNTLLILGLLFSLWVLSVKIKNVSIIDLFWGMGFVILGWVGFLYLGHLSVRGSIVLGAVTLWGCRLSLYLAFRNAGKPEDFRYRAMRVNMGTHFAMVSLFSVFWQPTKHLVEQFHHVFVQRISFFRAVECDDCGDANVPSRLRTPQLHAGNPLSSLV